ncbi:MAG: alpha/beta hydrolase [Chloroflexota bacterium]
MPLHPEVRKRLEAEAALGLPLPWQITPEKARAQRAAAAGLPGPQVGSVSDHMVETPNGTVPVRLYKPLNAGENPLPVLVWMHGGGWVIGSIASTDATARSLANAAGCAVVSVEYRLAPETKHPGPLADCYSAFLWTAISGAKHGLDTERVAVGGASAGGNLAAALALRLRNQLGPSPCFQLLVYPVTDARFETPSYQENAEGYGLTQRTMRWYWEQYLAAPDHADDPYAAPMRAESLSGLPPALVQTAEYDPLRDEGEAYAARMAADGVPVQCTRYPGMVHGFFNTATPAPLTEQAVAEAATALRTAFGGL